jgi:hypothetical protein
MTSGNHHPRFGFRDIINEFRKGLDEYPQLFRPDEFRIIAPGMHTRQPRQSPYRSSQDPTLLMPEEAFVGAWTAGLIDPII